MGIGNIDVACAIDSNVLGKVKVCVYCQSAIPAVSRRVETDNRGNAAARTYFKDSMAFPLRDIHIAGGIHSDAVRSVDLPGNGADRTGLSEKVAGKEYKSQ